MTEQLKRGGWIYILHDPKDRDVADAIRAGLNRLGHPIWNRVRDGLDLEEERAHYQGIERAAVVVLLVSVSLRESTFARELCEWADEYPRLKPRFIPVNLAGNDANGWFTYFRRQGIPMQQSLRETVHLIHHRIEMLRARPSTRPATAPEGARGRYAFVSYASVDDDKAVELQHQLARMSIKTWDYSLAARNARVGHYREELAQTIGRATYVLVVLTSAWLDSPDCRSEVVRARESRRRCVWLRYEPCDPPTALESDVMVDLRMADGEPERFELLLKRLRSARLGIRVESNC